MCCLSSQGYRAEKHLVSTPGSERPRFRPEKSVGFRKSQQLCRPDFICKWGGWPEALLALRTYFYEVRLSVCTEPQKYGKSMEWGTFKSQWGPPSHRPSLFLRCFHRGSPVEAVNGQNFITVFLPSIFLKLVAQGMADPKMEWTSGKYRFMRVNCKELSMLNWVTFLFFFMDFCAHIFNLVQGSYSVVILFLFLPF